MCVHEFFAQADDTARLMRDPEPFMHNIEQNLLNLLYYVPFTIIWVLVCYQFVLAVAGYIYTRRVYKDREEILLGMEEFPNITILVPAHNEEKVIERTVRYLLALDYPVHNMDLLVIDDASSDATPQILDRLAAENKRVKVLHRTKEEGGIGKADALNAALKVTKNEFIAIYDADNCPEPAALKLLIAQFVRNPELAGVVGKFRTGNKRRNLLTRFINIEGLGFQGIMQAGRSQLWGIAALSGTNYIIRRSVVDELGGWDIEALAEDAELSVRIYQAGYKIAYVPYSVSWEQEPETMAVWLKQRTRWARGNNYTVMTLLQSFWRSKSKLLTLEILYTLFIPYMLLFGIIAAQIAFVCSMFGVYIMAFSGPTAYWWPYAIMLYYIEVVLVLSYDVEDTYENFIVSLMMYFTYCQAWPLAVLRALYMDVILRQKRTWDKTVRFDTRIEPENRALVLGGHGMAEEKSPLEVS
ncbi:MAG: glycosyltransferase family 2 protein [Armatimonadota bacterium]